VQCLAIIKLNQSRNKPMFNLDRQTK
jgi:hypothetical protein